jgi:hypothetical protein
MSRDAVRMQKKITELKGHLAWMLSERHQVQTELTAALVRASRK